MNIASVFNWRALDGARRLALAGALTITVAALTTLSTLAFGWIDAAQLLVGVSLLRLIARAHEPTPHHLPFHDGTLMIAAGLWTGALALVNLFDGADGLTQLIVIIAAIPLVLAGARLRLVEDMYWWE